MKNNIEAIKDILESQLSTQIPVTIGRLLISAIAGLILNIKVKVCKKNTNGDEANVDIDIQRGKQEEKEVTNEN